MNKTDSPSKEAGSVTERIGVFLKRFGPRMAGTQAALDCAHEVKQALDEYCDRSFLQSFSMHPASFWSIPPLTAAGFTISGLLFLLQAGPMASLIPIGLGFVYSTVHFIFLGRLFDPLFPQKQGLNVVGVMEPREKPRQQIVICAHHDSARRCRFMENRQTLYPFRMIPAMLIFVLTTFGLFLGSLPISGMWPILQGIIFWLFLSGFFFIVPFFFFYRRTGSPGAGDNLLGVMLLIETARQLRNRSAALRSTRLILVSHDGEEIGMRGARAFVAGHRTLLDSCPTVVLNIDSLHRLEDLILLKSDRNGTLALSAGLRERLRSLWQGSGYRVKSRSLPLGGGGTDAAVYADAGFPSASLIGISTDFVRSGLVYHTILDDRDHLDLRIIPVVLDMIARVLAAWDREDCSTDLFSGET